MSRSCSPGSEEILADTPLFDNVILAIAPSWQCDADCLHCFIPKALRSKKGQLSRMILDSIDSLPADIRVLSFTGGEPFIQHENLLGLVAQGCKRGRYSSVVTNGLWSRRIKKINEFLHRFYAAGLRGMSVSIDDYHYPSLTDDEICELLSIARSLGMSVNVRGAGREAELKAVTIKKSGVLENQEGSEHFFSLENVGNATTLPRDIKFSRKKLEYCFAATQPMILPDGKVVACCSAQLFGIRNSVLEIGHLAEEKLDNILNRSRRSYLLAALAATGPLGLLDILGRKEKIKNRTRCEVCLGIINEPENVAELRRRIAESKQLRKEIAGRMMIWEHCYRPELLPQFQRGV